MTSDEWFYATENVNALANDCERLAKSGPQVVSHAVLVEALSGAADMLRELAWQRGWWESNYGNGILAPSKEFNDRVMAALDTLETPEMKERLATSAAAMETALASGQPLVTLDDIRHERDPEKYRTRTDPDAAFSAFMSMPEDEWLGLLLSLAGGGVLEPAEQQGFDRAVKARG